MDSLPTMCYVKSYTGAYTYLVFAVYLIIIISTVIDQRYKFKNDYRLCLHRNNMIL